MIRRHLSSSRESRRTAATVFTLHFSDVRKSLSDNADLAAIHLRGIESFESLDGVEKLRFGSELGRVMILSEEFYLFYLEGVLDAELWHNFERTTADLVAFPGVQAWWATRKHWHSQTFRVLVDGMIAQGKEPTLYDRYTNPGISASAPVDGAHADGRD